MEYKAIMVVPDMDDFISSYALERGPGAKISNEDKYISAGRDDNGQPTLYHVDGLYGYPVITHGILSVSSGLQIDGLAAVNVNVSAGSVLLAMEGDAGVCILGAENADGDPAQSSQGPIGRNDPLSDDRWNIVVRPTLINIYPGLEVPLDSYRSANPESTPLDVWNALLAWMKKQ